MACLPIWGGAALTAFRVRRADGSALYAGGSWRDPGATRARSFESSEVVFRPGRSWASAATRAVYPVEWEVATPAGRHRVRALLDAQELDSRQSTGAVYWEGLSELLDERGTCVGLGYLENPRGEFPLDHCRPQIRRDDAFPCWSPLSKTVCRLE